MVRRFIVPVFVAALALGVAPSPSFGLGAGPVRPRFDDHYRCMYRCDERGESWRPEPRPPRPGWHWPPRPRPHPVRPSWHRPGCWLFCGPGSGGWPDPYWWCRPGHFYDPDGDVLWSGRHWPHRPCPPHRPGWYDHDRYDRYDRYRDRDRDDSGGYDAHRHHPRGRDF
jgi:hypothetical protein